MLALFFLLMPPPPRATVFAYATLFRSEARSAPLASVWCSVVDVEVAWLTVSTSSPQALVRSEEQTAAPQSRIDRLYQPLALKKWTVLPEAEPPETAPLPPTLPPVPLVS